MVRPVRDYWGGGVRGIALTPTFNTRDQLTPRLTAAPDQNVGYTAATGTVACPQQAALLLHPVPC